MLRVLRIPSDSCVPPLSYNKAANKNMHTASKQRKTFRDRQSVVTTTRAAPLCAPTTAPPQHPPPPSEYKYHTLGPVYNAVAAASCWQHKSPAPGSRCGGGGQISLPSIELSPGEDSEFGGGKRAGRTSLNRLSLKSIESHAVVTLCRGLLDEMC